MATVKIRNSFKTAYNRISDYGKIKFGNAVAEKLDRKLFSVITQLQRFPKSALREPILKDFGREYHSIMLHKHYKIIYYYVQTTDIVVLTTIWDMRTSTQKHLPL